MLRLIRRGVREKLSSHSLRISGSRYASVVAASALLLSRAYAEEVYEPPKATQAVRIVRKIDKAQTTLAGKASETLKWFIQVLRALIRCSMLWLRFLPAAVTSPALVLQSEAVTSWWWSVLRASICNAGPTFIKFSQWAAMRPDLFPDYVCFELSKLQSGAKKHSWAETQAILKRVLGDDFENILSIQEDSLVGSGCVAQVYRGKIAVKAKKSNITGRVANHQEESEHTVEVAVKVLHPGIRESMQLDLDLMRAVASALEWSGELLLRWCYPHFSVPSGTSGANQNNEDEKESNSVTMSSLESYPLRCVSLRESVQTFAAFMQSQLDLTQEGRSLDRLSKNFSDPKWHHRLLIPETIYLDKDGYRQPPGSASEAVARSSGAPLPYAPILPHPDILVETYQPGESMIQYISGVSAAAATEEANAAKLALNRELAALGLDAILKMLFEDNFVHADLHAGNVLVRRSGGPLGRPQLILLDAGLVVELKPFDRQNFVALFRAVIDNDGREVARLMMEYSPRAGATTTEGGSEISALAAVIRPDEYAEKMAAMVAYVHEQGLSLGKISVSELLRNVLRLSYEHNVKLESRFVSVVVAIMLAEGMGRRLDPNVDIIARARPFIRSATISMLLGK